MNDLGTKSLWLREFDRNILYHDFYIKFHTWTKECLVEEVIVLIDQWKIENWVVRTVAYAV